MWQAAPVEELIGTQRPARRILAPDEAMAVLEHVVPGLVTLRRQRPAVFDWGAIEEEAGRTLPSDFKSLAEWYPAFGLDDFLVWEWERVLGLLLREDYAPTLHKNLPHAERDSFSEPADLAHMDTLCAYLTPPRGHLPHDWPQVTLRKPSVDERLDAALALDAAGARSPDQKLLRILLRDDQSAFEHALRDRLEEHRATVGEDPAPRSLLPLDAIALAALAVQVHGWSLQTTSGYLPAALLNAPAASNA